MGSDAAGVLIRGGMSRTPGSGTGPGRGAARRGDC